MTTTTGTRVAIGSLGVLGGLYGAYLVLSRGHDLLNLVFWLAGGVVLHDAVLSMSVIAIGALVFKVVPDIAKAPVTVGFVVLGSLTLLAIPVLGKFGERSDNVTLLDRNYLVGWLVVAGLTFGCVAVATVVRSRRRRP
jgi:hypothetical protein